MHLLFSVSWLWTWCEQFLQPPFVSFSCSDVLHLEVWARISPFSIKLCLSEYFITATEDAKTLREAEGGHTFLFLLPRCSRSLADLSMATRCLAYSHFCYITFRWEVDSLFSAHFWWLSLSCDSPAGFLQASPALMVHLSWFLSPRLEVGFAGSWIFIFGWC